MSSLTLHWNLFQEFQPMGGMGARFADGDAPAWAEEERTARTHTKNMAEKNPFIFMGNVVPERVANWYCALRHLQCRVIPRGQEIRRRHFMRRRRSLPSIMFLVCSLAFAGSRVEAQTAKTALGSFEGHNDVGTVLHA